MNKNQIAAVTYLTAAVCSVMAAVHRFLQQDAWTGGIWILLALAMAVMGIRKLRKKDED